MQYTHRCWAEISLDNARYNFDLIRRLTEGRSKIMAVIKADAYGHSAVVLAGEYVKCGVDWFAVSNIDEALELRNAGIGLPILILGYTPPECAGLLSRHSITQTVFSREYACELAEAARRCGCVISIHLKIDTGMSRIGLFYHDQKRDATAVDDAEYICRLSEFEHDGIFTHFSAADAGDEGEEFTNKQFELFTGMISRLAERGITFKNRHCCNSAAIIDYPRFHLDMVRPGIILYGLQPSSDVRNKVNFKPVMSLKSVVSNIKSVPQGTDISYGRTFTTSHASTIATVPVGYADGYPRLLSSKADMLVCGKRARVCGRVCMDQLMLDVTGIDGVHTGMEIVCMGESGGERITADELAGATGTINYELTCGISKRVPRIFIDGGKKTGFVSHIPSTGYFPL